MDSLALDLHELKNLYFQSLRPSVRASLLALINELESNINNLKEKELNTLPKNNENVESKQQMCNLKISTYAYDQSDKFFKIILTKDMKGIQSHPDDKILTEFSENSLKVTIKEFNNANHELIINHLYGSIIPKESCFKKKNDMGIIMLKKASSDTWSQVSKRNVKPEIKTPKIDKDKDPNESLMDMMKQMYEDGDDEMKRTIAKAWSESRNKNSPI